MIAPARPPTETDVLVVGAGPVGLAVAASLAERGIDAAVVDRQAEGANTSRAAVVHPATLEALDEIGISERLAPLAIQSHGFTIRDRDRVLLRLRFDNLPSRHPYMLLISQAVTERVLLERLIELGGKVFRPYVVGGLVQDAKGVTVTLAGGERIRARYVVGADGMHSTVRESAGIGFGKDDAGESFTLADVRLSAGLPADEVELFFSTGGMMVAAPLPDGSFRIVARVDDPPDQPGVDFVQGLVDNRGPAATRVLVQSVIWGSRFRIHHQVADRFRSGRVVLAGDAAHVHSPAGGQGMNLGLRDAIALGSALGGVIAGGPDSALDDYATRRRPLAREVVQFADRLTALATAGPGLRPWRNTALAALGSLPMFRRELAMRLAGLASR